MKKRFWAALISCALALGCCFVSAAATDVSSPEDPVVARVSGRLDHKISANTIVAITEWFSLEDGDIIKYDCTYTPASASMDFGFFAPDGLFYSLNTTSGSINKSIQVNQTGQYRLAIRNNEDYAVTVTGTVKY